MQKIQGNLLDDRDGRQQGTSEERIRLVKPYFPLDRNPRKRQKLLQNGWSTRKKQAVLKLNLAVHAP